MAERQPMLSFAKVVSGQIEGLVSTQDSADVPAPSVSTQHRDPPQKGRERGNRRQHDHDRPHKEKNSKSEHQNRRKQHRKDRRGPKAETPKEEIVAPVEEEVPEPVAEPVVLEPAPLPAENAWFKKKGKLCICRVLHIVILGDANSTQTEPIPNPVVEKPPPQKIAVQEV